MAANRLECELARVCIEQIIVSCQLGREAGQSETWYVSRQVYNFSGANSSSLVAVVVVVAVVS